MLIEFIKVLIYWLCSLSTLFFFNEKPISFIEGSFTQHSVTVSFNLLRLILVFTFLFDCLGFFVFSTVNMIAGAAVRFVS